MRGVVLFLGFLWFSGLTPAFAEDLPHYLEVTSGISRGGRPSPVGLTDLKQMGIKTIINLENDRQAVGAERVQAAQLGLAWVNEPMGTSDAPSDAEVSQVLQLMSDPRRQPVFIHCHFGEDRTGLMVGLYRVLVQRWTPAQAYREMLEQGFHSQFQSLDRYFRMKTGLR